MNEEPELGTTMDDQIDRFKRSHAAQIRRYDLKMRNMYVVAGHLLAGRERQERRVEGGGDRDCLWNDPPGAALSINLSNGLPMSHLVSALSVYLSQPVTPTTPGAIVTPSLRLSSPA